MSKKTWNIKHWILLASLSIGLFHCTPNPYAKTNRDYKKQAKQFAKDLRKQPQGLMPDSIARYRWWVGTINFNMRKPNFVVIHHTAQNSCDQTLRTFTVSRTQVSAHYVICKAASFTTCSTTISAHGMVASPVGEILLILTPFQSA